MTLSQSIYLLICLSLAALTFVIMTGYHILVELIDLMNSCNLTQIVNFPTWIPGCDSHSLALLDFFLSSDTSICSTIACPPLGNSDHVVVFVFSRYFCKQLNIILWFAILQFMERYMHHWLQTLKKYNITKNDTIPASESFSFQNTGKWSGVASNKYSIYKNDIQLQLGPTVTW